MDIWDVEMEFGTSYDLLEDFDFNILKQQKDLEAVPALLLMQCRARLKSQSPIWIIHKYDAHLFPSSPHAHLLDDNLKLDLSNGNCHKNKAFIYKISTKTLIKIRQMVSNVYKGDFPKLAL